MDKTVKILVIICIILVAGIGIVSGMLLKQNSINNQQSAVQNNTTVQVSISNSTNKSESESSGPKLIDQMKMEGGGSGDVPRSSDTLKAYEYDPDYVEVIINMHNLDTGEKTKQINTFKKLSGNELVETIKISGDSESTVHHHITSFNAVEYYWKVWKPNLSN